MSKVGFRMAILDEFGYPISRYDLNIQGEIAEDSVRKAIEEKISEITIVMRAIEDEGKSVNSMGRK